jgi:hypothetical protein
MHPGFSLSVCEIYRFSRYILFHHELPYVRKITLFRGQAVYGTEPTAPVPYSTAIRVRENTVVMPETST